MTLTTDLVIGKPTGVIYIWLQRSLQSMVEQSKAFTSYPSETAFMLKNTVTLTADDKKINRGHILDMTKLH